LKVHVAVAVVVPEATPWVRGLVTVDDDLARSRRAVCGAAVVRVGAKIHDAGVGNVVGSLLGCEKVSQIPAASGDGVVFVPGFSLTAGVGSFGRSGLVASDARNRTAAEREGKRPSEGRASSYPRTSENVGARRIADAADRGCPTGDRANNQLRTR